VSTIVYQVRDWNQHFENNKSRERDACHFVCVPNKQDGMGLNRLLSHPNGTKIYGVFHLIIGACSRHKKPRLGWLTDTGRAPDGHCPGTAWAPSDLAFIWRRPISEIEEALEVLSSPNIGWLNKIDKLGQSGARQVPVECPPSARVVPAECLGREGKEGNEQKEGKGTESAPPPALRSTNGHIPSEREFFDEFMNDGIPTDYLRKQWVWFDGNDAWLTHERRLKKWQSIVRQRWVEDRARWEKNRHATNSKNNGSNDRNAGTANANQTGSYSAAARARLAKPVPGAQ
jgi:hypothetical protein